MIEVSIEVSGGAVCFGTAVRAKSIRQALSIAGDRYSGSDLRVVFPIAPETFFVEDLAAAAETIETPESVAV